MAGDTSVGVGGALEFVVCVPRLPRDIEERFNLSKLLSHHRSNPQRRA